MESLGKMMLKAKKEFELEDLKDMISYFDTIKTKIHQK